MPVPQNSVWVTQNDQCVHLRPEGFVNKHKLCWRLEKKKRSGNKRHNILQLFNTLATVHHEKQKDCHMILLILLSCLILDKLQNQMWFSRIFWYFFQYLCSVTANYWNLCKLFKVTLDCSPMDNDHEDMQSRTILCITTWRLIFLWQTFH